MIKKWIICSFVVLSFPLIAEETIPVDFDRLSETLGHLIVRQLQQPELNFQLDKVIQGMCDERQGKPSPMTEEEYEQMVASLQEQQFLKAAEQNLAAADAFLKENAKKEGVQILEEKLQYLITKNGSGDSVGSESVPLVHYKGQLIDGTIFASSEDLNQPIALPIKQAIPGFAKGLLGMNEGEKRTLYIHPELAYGLTGQLPPNSLLIFDVEVVKANGLASNEMAQNETIEPPVSES